MREKSEVFEILRQRIIWSERFLGRQVKAIRSDNGGEYENNKVENFCVEREINRELTNSFTPETNGTVENYNQTVVDGARTMLKESGLDLKFWPEVVLHLTYTWNRI